MSMNVSGFHQIVKNCVVLIDDEVNVHGFFQVSHEFGGLHRKIELALFLTLFLSLFIHGVFTISTCLDYPNYLNGGICF